MVNVSDIFMGAWSIDTSHAPNIEQVTAYKNTRASLVTFNRYANIAAHRIEWEGCPPTISPRVLRDGLLWYPLMSFFVVGNATMALPSMPGGRGYNPNGEFADGFAYGKNGKVYHIGYVMPGTDETALLDETPGPATKCDFYGACIRENDFAFPFINTVCFYTEQTTDLIRALENQRILQKHPIGLYTTQEQKNTWGRWFQQLDDNMPIMFLNKNKPKDGREQDKAEVVDLMQGGDIVKPTAELLDWFEQRFYSECGVDNMGSQVDKKGENMIGAEVHASDDVTNLVGQGLANYLNDQLEEHGIRKLPGCENLRAVVRKETYDVPEEQDIQPNGGSENGDISENDTGITENND